MPKLVEEKERSSRIYRRKKNFSELTTFATHVGRARVTCWVRMFGSHKGGLRPVIVPRHGGALEVVVNSRNKAFNASNIGCGHERHLHHAWLSGRNSSNLSLICHSASQEDNNAVYMVDEYDEREGSLPRIKPMRRKPLKINLDLALYRARQLRIQSNRVSNPNDRAKLSREAESSLRQCIDMDPEDGRAYVILGKILVQKRRYDEAEALYDSGCAATRGVNPFLWTSWANLAVKRGNVSLARKLFDAAIVADSRHAAAYHGWGLLEKAQGNFARARDIWIRGIDATRPDGSPYLFQSLAVLAVDLNKSDEARRWFREGTLATRGRDSHAIWHAWACMEVRLGSDENIVRQLFEKGLQASPRSRYTFLSWALWEKNLGNINYARELFRKGTAMNRSDAALPQAWALMEESQGNLDEARRLFKKASRADPKHLYVWQAWGCMEQRAGNVDEARELFQQGVWAATPRAKDTSLIFQAWALLEQDQGNIELARELFKCAVKADASSEPSWLAWAQMEEEQGLYNRAAELRNFSMQEKQIVQLPANFSTLKAKSRQDSFLGPFFTQLGKWMDRYENASKTKEQNEGFTNT